MSKYTAPLMTICRVIAAPFYRLLFPVKVEGSANYHHIPRDQPIIIVSNHHSYFDPVSIIVFVNRNIHFLAKKELFDGHFGWFFRGIGLIEVNRNRDNSGIDNALGYLHHNRVIAIFPEGTTKFKKSNQLLPFKYGAIRLARQSGAIILPVAVTGKPKLFHANQSIVRFGRPYTISHDADLNTETAKLRQQIAKLMRLNGVKNVDLIPGKPAHNPGEEPPQIWVLTLKAID